MSRILLETQQLVKSFGGLTAVDNVDFTLHEGELRCFIGPNGAGKSTFFNLITAQLRPTRGSIRFKGVEISRFHPFQVARLGIGIKFQVPMVYDALPIRDNLWLAARWRHPGTTANEAVDRVLAFLELHDRAHIPLRDVTHSERQWVEIGMVVVGGHELILLDEPTAGMTQAEAFRTAELLKEINRSATVIVVEHDMAFVRRIATRVTVFHRGRVFAEGTMEEIRANPAVREIYLGKGQQAHKC